MLATIAEDEQGTIVGGTASGDVPFTVVDATTIEMDEVRGTGRVRRSGYLLEARTLPGDSGAGLYDDAGHLVGLLFAVSTEDGTRSWATAAVEIEAFLADDGVTGRFRCDPEQSELRAIAD